MLNKVNQNPLIFNNAFGIKPDVLKEVNNLGELSYLYRIRNDIDKKLNSLEGIK